MNENRQFWAPVPGPPQGDPPSPELYKTMGEEGFFALLEDFYELLSKSSIASHFPESKAELIQASRKSACFFVGLCGGPPLFHQNFGPPRMRQRHMPFLITMSDREVWLSCFNKVLEQPGKYAMPEELLPGFVAFLERFSLWMVNTQE